VDSVYFESSVFLAVISGEKNGPQIRSLLKELKRKGIRIYTSIITVQEIAVLSFRRGTVADDPASKLHKMARIVGITKEMALTAAKLEAQLKDLGKLPKDEDQIIENRRRKWDCFHVAAAMCLKCGTVFSSDEKFLKRKTQLGITSLHFSPPVPTEGQLDLRPEKGSTETHARENQPSSPEVRGSGGEHPEGEASPEVGKKDAG
jgi:predicted nucleic acid-binding protein